MVRSCCIAILIKGPGISFQSLALSQKHVRNVCPGCPQRLEKLEKGMFYKFWLEKLENMYLLQQQRLENLENVFFQSRKKSFSSVFDYYLSNHFVLLFYY